MRLLYFTIPLQLCCVLSQQWKRSLYFTILIANWLYSYLKIESCEYIWKATASSSGLPRYYITPSIFCFHSLHFPTLSSLFSSHFPHSQHFPIIVPNIYPFYFPPTLTGTVEISNDEHTQSVHPRLSKNVGKMVYIQRKDLYQYIYDGVNTCSNEIINLSSTFLQLLPKSMASRCWRQYKRETIVLALEL